MVSKPLEIMPADTNVHLVASQASTHSVTLAPRGGRFDCRPEQSVLDAAIAAGYWLPHSCRNGTCGSCDLQVLQGRVRHAPSDPSAPPLPEGQCRSCRAHAESDLVLNAPGVPREAGRRVVATGAKVLDVRRASRDVAVVRLHVPPRSGFGFTPGQYVDVVLKDGARRSYSLANAPDPEGQIEWHVRRMHDGRFSTYVYDQLRPGAMLRIEGPFGAFGLQQSHAPVVMVATGTGYAPIAALLQAHGPELARRGAVLYWGVRSVEDLYAANDLDAWQARHRGVRLVPVLSEPGASWTGRSGFVHEAVLADHPDLSGHEVYACGNPLMVEAARARFIGAARLPATRFFADAFIARH